MDGRVSQTERVQALPLRTLVRVMLQVLWSYSWRVSAPQMTPSSAEGGRKMEAGGCVCGKHNVERYRDWDSLSLLAPKAIIDCICLSALEVSKAKD